MGVRWTRPRIRSAASSTSSRVSSAVDAVILCLAHLSRMRERVRLAITDDLRRSRLTVFFRLLLAIPHIVWVILWTIAVVPAALVTWFATLVAGRPPEALHGFLSAYTRYSTHLSAYLFLAANPYPGFTGEPGYPVDLELPGPAPQARWKTAFRLVLALPGPAPDGGARKGLDGRRRRWRKHQQRRRPRLELPTLGRRARRGVRDPRLVRGARAREDAERAPQSRGLRPRLLRPDDRLPPLPDRRVPELRSGRVRPTLGASGSCHPGRVSTTTADARGLRCSSASCSRCRTSSGSCSGASSRSSQAS